MNTYELHRKSQIMGLSARIRYHRIAMDSEEGITERWKHHMRCHNNLCRYRAEMYTPEERAAIELREGLI